MKTKEEIYAWLDKQIEAVEIQLTPLYEDDPYYICTAGTLGRVVHIYKIQRLCKELDIPWTVEKHSDEYNRYYFMYRDYKIYGLVEKGEMEDEEEITD